MKVLIVDDNKQVRRLLRDCLPTSYDEIYECNDGNQAFALYQTHRPDLVLMDWEMPLMNGITAMREIIAKFPKANICIVTAFDNEDLRDEAFRAGASGFVLKSKLFDLEGLLRVTPGTSPAV